MVMKLALLPPKKFWRRETEGRQTEEAAGHLGILIDLMVGVRGVGYGRGWGDLHLHCFLKP